MKLFKFFDENVETFTLKCPNNFRNCQKGFPKNV